MDVHVYTYMSRTLMYAQATTHTSAHERTRADGPRRRVSAFRHRNTPLHGAAWRGHADVVEALLAHGADVHAEDKSGCGGRSLFWAAVGVRRAGRG
jgi:hypothetical protein